VSHASSGFISGGPGCQSSSRTRELGSRDGSNNLSTASAFAASPLVARVDRAEIAVRRLAVLVAGAGRLEQLAAVTTGD
jgi:hypothetical protein